MLCRNEEEAKEGCRGLGAALIASLERKLAHGDKTLVSNKGYRRFLATPRDDHFTIDPKRVAQDERFDGVFVLRTNAKMSALQVVLRYRNLLAVEDTFKTAKALLATRPIFSQDRRAAIRGHVFCSFLAVLLRKELLDRVSPPTTKSIWSGSTIVDDLADLSEIEVGRTAGAPGCEPLHLPRSTPSAVPSVSPCHRFSRSCHRPPPQPNSCGA